MIDRGDPPVLQSIVDTLPAGLFAKDAGGRYTHANGAMLGLMLDPAADYRGATDAMLFATANAAVLAAQDQAALAAPVAYEGTITTPDGLGERRFLIRKQPLRDAQGQVFGLSGIALDITDMDRRRRALEATLDALPDLVFEFDLDGRYLECHSARDDLLIAPLDRMLGRTMAELMPPEPTAICMRSLREAATHGRSRGLSINLDVPAGNRWFEISTTRVADDGSGIPRFITVSRDITAQKQAEDALRESNALLRAVVDNTPVEYWARDLDGRCIMQNAQVVRHWGDLLGRTVDQTSLSAEDRAKWDENNRRVLAGEIVDNEIEYEVDGERRIFQNLLAPIWTDGRIVGSVGFNQDITDRKRTEEQVAQLAFYDPLTNLPNRRLMLDRLTHAATGCARRRDHGALLLIDIDNFKALNDTLGHDMGDRLLVEVAARLETATRRSDTAARLGGDEFVVILENLDGDVEPAFQAEHLARRIQRVLGEPYGLMRDPSAKPPLTFHCTSSMGIALFGPEGLSAEEVLRRADTAMYQAKAGGRNAIVLFDPVMQARVDARAQLEADMHQAAENQDFRLYYQPQVDPQQRIVGAEALLRWHHPERGMVPPGEFIPLAEETGLIARIGLWALAEACRQLVRWAQRPDTAHLVLSVNVSALQFRLPAFIDQVRDVLARTGAPPDRLMLELTESLLLHDADDVITRMDELKSLGVKFSLDDFGTGYSSLAYLKKLPLDQLKIDRGFIRDLLDDPVDAAIARTIVSLADSLHLSVVAEGVETVEQLRYLAGLGCLEYQGFLFSPAVPVEAFDRLVAERRLLT
ncbi:sensor domain-containing protein [Zavarzinia sp. CC-PAN008]|uniref:sensor domain-containing protein n=1 Tax=Zavarzinia sp. CC-PAN008 TaxID=3243332 RepID=UPI003F74891F